MVCLVGYLGQPELSKKENFMAAAAWLCISWEHGSLFIPNGCLQKGMPNSQQFNVRHLHYNQASSLSVP